MKRVMRLQEPLIYYDGIQLFSGIDQLSTLYLCLLVEDRGIVDVYLCAPISQTRLNKFYEGSEDLRDIFTNPEIDELYTIKVSDISEGKIPLILFNPHNLKENWLPDHGFSFCKETPEIDAQIVGESQQRKKAIVHLSLNPPEAREQPQIDIFHLTEALNCFQNLVRYAYSHAKRTLDSVSKTAIEMVPDHEKLEAIGFSNGSFTIHLQSKTYADLLGFSEISRGLRKIDEITQNLENPERALLVLQQNKGHFAQAYLHLLEYIMKYDAPIKYKWTSPELSKPISLSISRETAERAYKVFSKSEDLGVETVVLIGRLTKVDTRYKKWTLITTDNKIHSGSISKKSQDTLKGVIMETQIYRFICEETSEEIQGTGQEKISLFLLHLEPV